MASQPPSANGAVKGQADPANYAGQFNQIAFMISQGLARLNTTTLCQVVAVHGGGVAAVGTVDIQPLVMQVDGQFQPTPHGVIYGVPYFRIQAGVAAFICDPVAGSIGMAAFASRDLSAVIATQAQAPPGSYRRFDIADAMFFGSFLGALPTTYVEVLPNGDVNVVGAAQVNVNAPVVNITSPTVNLGATGGEAVARVGDTVSGGVITSGSSKVKCA